jgi:AcrR family transcriptional regulator
MEFQVKFSLNEKIFVKNPESSDTGREIVKRGIDLIYDMGFENFTFKKLAQTLNTSEATIYRYFENKHRLLLYITNWYWSFLQFLVEYKLQNVTDPKVQLKIIIQLLTHDFPDTLSPLEYNKLYLNKIVIAESSKVYLVKEVNEINKKQVFKPYKDLCAKLAGIISAYNPHYAYPLSLSSTLIETSHHQQFFSLYLPKLTDVSPENKTHYTSNFLEDLLFGVLAQK